MLIRLLAVLLFAAATSAHGETTGASLKEALLSLGERDQSEVNSDEPSNDVLRSHVVELKQIVSDHGWPRISNVGQEAAKAAWLVAQHADFDIEFQREALRHLESLAPHSEAEPKLVGYLTDRLAVNEGRPQVYGTQGQCNAGRWEPKPIADPDGVDQRRASVSMEPLALYAQMGTSMLCSQHRGE